MAIYQIFTEMFQEVRKVPCKIHTLISYIQSNIKLPNREGPSSSLGTTTLQVLA
jgi:hypothetical protein